MLSPTKRHVAAYGIGAVLLGFAIDALSAALAYPMTYPTDPSGNPVSLMRGMTPSTLWSLPNPSWLAVITADSRAHALSHLGIALMIFGFALIAIVVYVSLTRPIEQKVD